VAPDYLLALGLTLIVELPIYGWFGSPGQRGGIVLTGLAANLVSHPIAWWLILGAGAPFLIAEFGVVVFEAAALRLCGGITLRRAALAALTANLVTMSLSFLL
jgi:hypothetical protein